MKKLRIAIMMSNYLQMEGSNWRINQRNTSQAELGGVLFCVLVCYEGPGGGVLFCVSVCCEGPGSGGVLCFSVL